MEVNSILIAGVIGFISAIAKDFLHENKILSNFTYFNL